MKPETSITKSTTEKIIVGLFSSPQFIGAFTATILTIGFSCDAFGWSQQGFERSGSVVVMFTIAVVFVNHLSGTIEARNEETVSTLENLSKPQALRDVAKDYAAQSKISEEAALTGLEAAIPKLLEESRANRGAIKSVRGNLTNSEAFIGILGTFVWGFGDLLS